MGHKDEKQYFQENKFFLQVTMKADQTHEFPKMGKQQREKESGQRRQGKDDEGREGSNINANTAL